MDLKNWLKDKQDYKLCYVHNNFAYFTNKLLSEQWGDDWDDSPYEHNAGEPYYDTKDQIIKVAFDGYDIQQPCDFGGYNSSYSVKMINSGVIAWLTGYNYNTEKYTSIQAGANIVEFIKKMRDLGDIYLPF